MTKKFMQYGVYVFILVLMVTITSCRKEVATFSENTSTPDITVLPDETEQTIETTIAPTIEPAVEPTIEPTNVPDIEPEQIDYSVIKPYEVGQIMIIMYHGIVESDPPSSYQRTVADFINDLQTLYDRDYRLLSMKDLIDNNITVEAGFTPVVLTFDDGLPSSFSLIEIDGEFVPTPNSAFDLLQQFCEANPDFGMGATFYMNGDNDPFKGAGTLQQRLQFLIENNCDIGNHTYDHGSLTDMNAEQIQEEIGLVDQMIKEALPGYEPVGISYPYGQRPISDLRELILDGIYAGKPYSYMFGLKEGQSGAHAAPNNQKFDKLNIPRVRGSNDDPNGTDLWGMLEFYVTNPEYRYISDGNPQTITVPNQYVHNVLIESLGNKELILYD